MGLVLLEKEINFLLYGGTLKSIIELAFAFNVFAGVRIFIVLEIYLNIGRSYSR